MIQAVSNWFEHLKENSCAVVKKETAVLIHINQTKLLQLIRHWRFSFYLRDLSTFVN